MKDAPAIAILAALEAEALTNASAAFRRAKQFALARGQVIASVVSTKGVLEAQRRWTASICAALHAHATRQAFEAEDLAKQEELAEAVAAQQRARATVWGQRRRSLERRIARARPRRKSWAD